ncbi:uncharacterized protein LOC144175396 [Haemaphysalis longicornis]
MRTALWDHVDTGNPPCFAAYKGYEDALGLLCRGIIRNVNAFWTALGFCLWMFMVLGCVSHFLSKYFLRMVNWTYDGSEVESFSSTLSSSTSTSGGSENEELGAAPGEGAAGPKEAKKEGSHPPPDGSSEMSEDKHALPKWAAAIGGTLQRMHLEDQ